MTASLHKLTAGSGYDYLTRQVAAMDSTGKGRTSLASYYSEKGEVPGRWVGTALAALEVPVGSAVTAEQMRALFGAGMHPDMAARLAALPVDASPEQVRDAARLGAPFKVHSAATRFQEEVADRSAQWATKHGLDGGEVPLDVLAEIRNDIAREQFITRIGRTPNAVELSSEVARLSRNPTTACAGYDITFTPVKSVSTLWAVAPQAMAAQIEQAHDAAVADALRYLEQRVLFSRRGAAGIRQVEVTGLIGAAFTHRDSRAGDPNLHTHVAIANKVQTLDGAWLAIDGRPLHAGMVSISEVYNTQLEAHLTQRLGLRFAAGPHRDPSKRPVREIIGVPSALREAWSSRRAAIETRQAELATIFQEDHGRPPTPVEALKLAQQATLETREAKHEPRTLAEQRAAWRGQADATLGPDGTTRMLRAVQAAAITPTPSATPTWIEHTAAEIVTTMGSQRAAWTVWHLRAEASRRARERATSPEQAAKLTEDLLQAASGRCLSVDTWRDPFADPAELRRSTGESVYTTVGSQRFTSASVIDAEQRILTAAARTDGRAAAEVDVSIALLASTTRGVTLNAGQIALVREMATSRRRVELAMAAAGSGKTTALAVLADAWRESGGEVLGLAPSAVAARQLADQIGHATTLAKLAHELRHNPRDAQDLVGPEALIIIDEAGMADTPTLATIIDHAMHQGASVRLIGDDHQLAAIGAGGILRDIVHTYGAVELTEILRFTDPAEAAASLALRDGRIEALAYHLDHDRLHPGTPDTTLQQALNAWLHDQADGRDSLMVASTQNQVTILNTLARDHRLATGRGDPGPSTVLLADGNHASVGDVIVTRMNDRRLRVSATDWVKNGDRWIITGLTPIGHIQAVHRSSGLRVLLPADYVVEHVRLGYALTVHGAQGITVDACHTVITGRETRQQLYVALTRGRHANHAYVHTVDATDENSPIHPSTLQPSTTVDVLAGVLARDGAAISATTQTRTSDQPSTRLGHAAARYTDALTAAIEHLHPDQVRELDSEADHIVSNLTDAPAWPTLRGHLLTLAAHTSRTASDWLRAVAADRELDTADDPAAVLTWRLPHPAGDGPLPWLPPVPPAVTNHDQWGPYITARRQQVVDYAQEVRDASAQSPLPAWATPGQHIAASLIAEVEVWRAACQIDPADRRPTGPTQQGALPRQHQHRLQRQLLATEPQDPYRPQLNDIRPGLTTDPFASILASRLAALQRSGQPVDQYLADAATEDPLPAEHPAAALWWRLTRHLDTDSQTGARSDAPVPQPTSTAQRLAQEQSLRRSRGRAGPTP